MKIYIAAASAELYRTKFYAREFEDQGHEIAHRWWEEIEERAARGLTDADLTPAEAQEHALGDADAIGESDVFLLLAPQEPTRGAWIEMGIALGLGIPVMICGDARTPFAALAAYQGENVAEVLRFLRGERDDG